jgi:uncharacterized membrane protein
MSKEEKIKRYLIWARVKRAVTARVVSLVVTSLVGWVITGNPLIGLSIGAVDLIIKLFLYYGHETIWEKKMTKDIKQIKLEYSE